MKFNVVAFPAGHTAHWRVLNLLLGDPFPGGAVGSPLRGPLSASKLALPLRQAGAGEPETRRRSLRLSEGEEAGNFFAAGGSFQGISEEASTKREGPSTVGSLSSAARSLARRVLTEKGDHAGHTAGFSNEQGLLACRSEACMKALHQGRGTHLLESTLPYSSRTGSTDSTDGTGGGFTEEEGLLACRGVECLEGMYRARGAHLMEQALSNSEGADVAGADVAGAGMSDEEGLLGCRGLECMQAMHRARGTHLLEQTLASESSLSSGSSGFQEVEGLLACRGQECLKAIHQARGTHLLEDISKSELTAGAKKSVKGGKKTKKKAGKHSHKAHRVQVASVQGLGAGDGVGMAVQGRKALEGADAQGEEGTQARGTAGADGATEVAGGEAALGVRALAEDSEDSVPKNWVRRGVAQGYMAGDEGASHDSHEGPGELPRGEEGEEGFEDSQTEDEVVPLSEIIP